MPMSSKRSLYPILRRGGWDGQFTDPLTAFGVEWTAPTWSISGGKVLNTPVGVTELLTDGGLENWSSATALASYTQILGGTSTVNRENSVIHGGTYASRADIDASDNNAIIRQIVTAAAGQWVVINYWTKSSATGKYSYVAYNTGGSPGPARNPGTTWTNYIQTARTSSANPYCYFAHYTAPSGSIYYDDLSVKTLAIANLIATRRTTLSNRNVITPPISALVAGTQAGIILACDNPDNPLNLVAAYCDGAGNIVFQKRVNGIDTVLATTAAAHSATKYFSYKKNGSTWSLYYATTDFGAQVGTDQTISDAEILSAPYVGIFSTDSRNQFNPASVYFQVKPYA